MAIREAKLLLAKTTKRKPNDYIKIYLADLGNPAMVKCIM